MQVSKTQLDAAAATKSEGPGQGADHSDGQPARACSGTKDAAELQSDDLPAEEGRVSEAGMRFVARCAADSNHSATELLAAYKRMLLRGESKQ